MGEPSGCNCPPFNPSAGLVVHTHVHIGHDRGMTVGDVNIGGASKRVLDRELGPLKAATEDSRRDSQSSQVRDRVLDLGETGHGVTHMEDSTDEPLPEDPSENVMPVHLL